MSDHNLAPSDVASDDQTIFFSSFGLDPLIEKAITEAGFTVPSPIQAAAIPPVMAGKDIIALAATGTGKTAAFGLPALHRIKGKKGVSLLIITPTRELAKQVSDELFRFGKYLGIQTATISGGHSMRKQVEGVSQGKQVIVATPGRLLDLLSSGSLPNFAPSIVVLDEADEMLNMGFLEDIQAIFSHLPNERQTLLFSATMPTNIQKLAEGILKNPVSIKIQSKTSGKEEIDQCYVSLRQSEKEEALFRFISWEDPTKALVFCKTKKDVDTLATSLNTRGIYAESLHGDMEQNQRNRVIQAFRGNLVKVLVATDVAARGLDVSDISHVFNYDLPFDPESYTHRTGRTGRAGRKGKAISFVSPEEFKKSKFIFSKSGQGAKRIDVPTLSSLKAIHRKRLLESILSQEKQDGAVKLLQELKDTHSIEDIIVLALSKLLEENPMEGPEKIGFDKDPMTSPDRDRGGRGRDRFSYSGGGRNRGGDRGESRDYRGDRDSRGGDRDNRGSDRDSRGSDDRRGSFAPSSAKPWDRNKKAPAFGGARRSGAPAATGSFRDYPKR